MVLVVGSVIRDLREESFFMCLCVSVQFVVVAVAVFDRGGGGGGGLDECKQEFMQSICRRKKWCTANERKEISYEAVKKHAKLLRNERIKK